MRAKLVNMALSMAAMLTMGATQALTGASAIKGGAARRLREKQSTKTRKRGALALISTMIAFAALVNAPLATAGPKDVRLQTFDTDPGGVMRAKTTYRESKKYPGYYEGSIDGTIQDTEEDGYCVIGVYSAAVKRSRGPDLVLQDRDLRPGIAACPKGASQTIHHPFVKAKDVKIRVCLTKNGSREYCSQYDH
jgi:hypothetical protein